MSIIDKLKSSVEAATKLPFYYDTPQTLNVRMSSGWNGVTFPCAMLHILQSGAVVDENGILRERLTIEMLFATTSNLDFDGVTVERDELDEMKKKAFAWLTSMRIRGRDNGLRLVSNNGTNRYYASDDAIFSAYGVNVTIEETQGFSPCDLESDKNFEEEIGSK